MQIKAHNVSKKINGNLIVDNINITLESGNIYGFIGANGSGKTMLLRLLTGLIIPTEGDISVDGKILHKDISFPPNTGLFIDKPEFIPYLNGFDNLWMLAEIRHKIKKDTVREWMNFFELDPSSKKWVRKYSQGMKQKLGIIQAIMEDPDFLVLDESFNALDEASVNKLREVLADFRKKEKLIVITSHNNEDIEMLCDKTFKISGGRIVE